ncbi:unnamed protein product [Didymodactylos carnosus]|uniref:BZIP domain-containing protein n=1 Tax=Didymodactylos carnosus TaxID=1234261 RepID=A0A813QQ23_9BILA|nr:unnamed protein product [Didymodactylos carnosus]CAF1068891.1 unnamed protein product [Didymodactylos carnosus]CAF3552432.1 unnamed protein product [Didymodactylos carnosus]CAF3833521.1 unnamed protein product [Didymodactylos carnosus]
MLTRSDSTTSTVIIQDEEINGNVQPLGERTISLLLRGLTKTSGRFNIDLENMLSPDKLNDLFCNTSFNLDNIQQFNLHRLLSTYHDDITLDELANLGSVKLLNSVDIENDSMSIDQLISSTNINEFKPLPSSVPTVGVVHHILPIRRTPSPDLITDFFPLSSDPESYDFQLKTECENYAYPPTYTQLNTLETIKIDAPQLLPTPPPSTSLASQSHRFLFDAAALTAIEHDHAFMSKKMPTSTSRKRRRSRTRLESASSIGSNAIQTSAITTSSSDTCVSSRTKRSRKSHSINCADDVKTADDLNHYLERRRRNNMASKSSRAARKQKFGEMDDKCNEYEKLNEELRRKISVLETVTAELKVGLVRSFQTATVNKTETQY